MSKKKNNKYIKKFLWKVYFDKECESSGLVSKFWRDKRWYLLRNNGRTHLD